MYQRCRIADRPCRSTSKPRVPTPALTLQGCAVGSRADLHEEGAEASRFPAAITTDGLRSYRGAMSELGNADKQGVG